MSKADLLQPKHGVKRPHRSHDDYTVALVFPLAVELAPLRAMLDTVHEDLPSKLDQNAYTLGELGHHNVVVASLPAIGNNDSGVVANQLRNDFPSIRFGLLVGIGGGVPDVDGTRDIRLGDVVVSEPAGIYGGVLQFDRGKQHAKDAFELTGHLNKPPQILLATIQKLKAEHTQSGNKILRFVDDMLRKNPKMATAYEYPGQEQDQLFEIDYLHQNGSTCMACSKNKVIPRTLRPSREVKVHYGTIGSSNSVLRDAHERDRLRRQHGIISVEMEAAGIMNTLPSLVIRGICDYADSHKNKQWQPYAAATAAAFAKELLLAIPPNGSLLNQRPSGNEIRETERHSPSPLKHKPNLNNDEEGEHRGMKSSTQVLVDSLAFERMDARLRNITDALPKTCRWVFKHPKFRKWLDDSRLREHHGFFWIKGNPGCGKSTIMKGILHGKKRRNSEVIVHYFFNARATADLEKSSLGLYRFVSHQLLLHCPQIQAYFAELFSNKIHHKLLTEDWSAAELKGFLIGSAQRLKTQPVTLLIDALDEGDVDDIADMISFLDDLASNACHSGSIIRICLSSRYFPNITIRKGITLKMEEEAGHEMDVETYVRSKLLLDSTEEMRRFQTTVCQKSNGIFLWIVLVVPMLNAAYNRGRMDEMFQCLQQLPPDLEGLFQQLLAKSDYHIKERNLLLTWVLFALRPLTALELYTAVRYDISKIAEKEFTPSVDHLRRYILDTSRGLVEMTRADVPVVQFIHETVRYFLPKQLAIEYDSTNETMLRATCHNRLKLSCRANCLDRKIDNIRINPMSEKPCSPGQVHQDSQQELQRPELVSKSYPFLEYASSYLFSHANLAEAGGIDQSDFLDAIDGNDRQAWITVRNVFQRYRVRRYSLNAPMLYIAADQGLSALVHRMLCSYVRDRLTEERYGTALQAASVQGHRKTVQMLVENGSNINAIGGECTHALLGALNHKHEEIAHYLLQNGAAPPLFDLERAFFTYIARGYVTGVNLMKELGVNPSSCKNARHKSALYMAVSRGNIELVRLFLQEGRDMDFDEDLECIRVAFGRGYIDVFRALLNHFSKNNTITIDCRQLVYSSIFRPGRTGPETTILALLNAVIANHYRFDQDPLSDEVDPSLPLSSPIFRQKLARYINNVLDFAQASSEYLVFDNALHAVSSNGFETMAEILIEAGGDVNRLGGYYRYPIIAATVNGHHNLVKTLIQHGANVGMLENTLWGTALHAASHYGRLSIIRLLVEAGADVHALNARKCTPLQVAALNGLPQAQKLLKELGATM